ncbi:defensin-like protein 1 [Prosopis cineraria]|uniref:defensin-like protein 1 n=1 Tax=Prosopis cineraria TaxID=364024 RepID=UPI00240EE3C8|nr:defensin-like protein 1 [Prosopis cineraria]
MERISRAGFGVLLVLLLVLASDEGMMAMETEGIWRHPCQVPSKRFKGLCMSDHNCANVCRTEGHSSGECEGARRRCLCSINC